jgi:hypothetical protein
MTIFCGGYMLEEEEEMKTHCIIVKHGTFLEYGRNIL